MAVTKIWDVKGRLDSPIDYVKNPEKTLNPEYDKAHLQALGDVIEYAANEDKTERHYFLSGLNCNTTYARRQFQSVKNHFDKDGGIVAYHGYQSFAEGEVTPEEAHRIGIELAEELWGDRFQVIIATHVNTKCLHNHFVINSISFKDGKRFRDNRITYRIMRETSDRICIEHNLSVVENPRRGKEPTNLYRAEKAGMPTRYNVARAAIDEAISKSCNMREFEMYLKQIGYSTQFNPKRKYWTVVPKGWEKPIRLARLGEEYTNERIIERVLSNPISVRMMDFQPKGKQYLLITRRDRIKKVGGLKGLYLKYCYELGYLPKYKQNVNRVHPMLKEDLMKCEMFTKQVRLIGKHEIADREDLAFFIASTNEKMEVLKSEREQLRKVIRRAIPEDDKVKTKIRISEISDRLKHLRDELKLAKDIEERSEVMEQRLQRIDVERNKEQRKERGK